MSDILQQAVIAIKSGDRITGRWQIAENMSATVHVEARSPNAQYEQDPSFLFTTNEPFRQVYHG